MTQAPKTPKTNENTDGIRGQIAVIKEHLKANPKDYTVMYALALRYYALQEYRNCSEICHKLIDLGAQQIEVFDTCARADINSGYYEDAIRALRTGVQKFPDSLDLLLHLAAALSHSGQQDEANVVNKKAMDLGGSSEMAYLAKGNYYMGIGDVERAVGVFEEGIAAFPASSGLLNNLGAIYMKADDFLKASEYYVAALRLEPANVKAIVNLGGAMEKLQNAFVGLQFYDEALRVDPENAMALCSKASAMCNNGLAQEAMPIFEHALPKMRDSNASRDLYNTNYSNYVFFQHYVPDRALETIYQTILQFNEDICSDIKEKPATTFENLPDEDKRLKVGLISKGFNVHPVGQMIFQALKFLDKDKFSLYCYTELAPERRDHLTEELYGLMDKVVSVNNMQSHAVNEIMREDGIDILIEMTGHSEGGRRLQLVAERAAPVQVKWVGGLFNTTGIPQMDWLISDHIETPEGVDKWYTEKIYRMPDDYIVYLPPFYAPAVSGLPAQKNGFVTFGNLNNLAKTNSYSIELWSKIMHKVPDSRILLKGSKMHEKFVQDHIFHAFEKHGIARERVLIEGGEKHQQFLNVYNRIDIALDPHPYTGGLTTCEALWMGVPVVTLPGDTFAGRHAATHLTNADLAQFIAASEQDYIDIAVRWAQDLQGLADLRAGMRAHVAKTPLVDGPRFAKNFEIALRHMWRDWCAQKRAADEGLSAGKSNREKRSGKGK